MTKSLPFADPVSRAQAVTVAYGLLLALLAAGLVTFFCGCAHFTTRQNDVSYENGQITRSITTTAKATTIFEAKSALANFKASQTDKTQSAIVGSLNQDASASNAVNEAAQFLGTLIKTAK